MINFILLWSKVVSRFLFEEAEGMEAKTEVGINSMALEESPK